MYHLCKLAQNPEAAQSYARVSDDLFDLCKKDFAPLSEGAEHGDEYRELVKSLNAARQGRH